MNNDRGLPQHLREVIHEASVSVIEEGKKGKKKPDYSFQFDGNVRFFVEAKKPSVNILTDANAVFQIRRYAWSANLPFSILTNFSHLVIYDCSVKPNEADDPHIARMAIYSHEEYLEKFNEIADLISKKAIVNETFKIRETNKKTAFDDYFLSQIKNWRLMLAKDISKENPKIDEEDLIYSFKGLSIRAYS